MSDQPKRPYRPLPRKPFSLRGEWYALRARTRNRWLDLRAVLAGYCNHCPWGDDPTEGGGYSFWRCSLRRGHEGLHRSRNYVWTDDGRTDYLPVPVGIVMPQQPWERNGIHRRRQDRMRQKWHEKQNRERHAKGSYPAGDPS